MTEVLGATFLQEWARTAVAALAAAREEIDALNVFPVPDGDTGTNLYLTMQAAAQSLQDALDQLQTDAGNDAMEELGLASRALVRGALLGARGNSGVILSQILRGLVQVDPLDDDGDPLPAAEAIREGLQRAAQMAYAAVADPKEGTMLTVMRSAAEAAGTCESGELGDVIRAATQSAAEALRQTQFQLEPLRLAGVVDSGGKGIVVILSALQEVMTGERPAPQELPVPAAFPDLAVQPGYSGPAYEVMYLLETDDELIEGLKRDLSGLGDSLVVVGGDGLWNIHVHVDDAGAAVESALGVGRPHRIRITYLLPAGSGVQPRSVGRGLVAVADGRDMIGFLRQMDVTVVAARPGESVSTGELLEAITMVHADEVVVLPGDGNVLPSAQSAAAEAQGSGIEAAVVASKSIVQSLAAIAVHDADRDFHDDVAGMTAAATATRTVAVTRATRSTETEAGQVEVGDIIGVVGGKITCIGEHELDVALRTIDEALADDGEIVTVVTGAAVAPELTDGVLEHLESAHPEVEVTTLAGGQSVWPLIFGVE